MLLGVVRLGLVTSRTLYHGLLESKKAVTGLKMLDFEVIDELIARIGYKQTLDKLWETATNKHE